SKKYNTRNCSMRPREEWIEIPNAYPPLFTRQEWEGVQALIDENDCNRKRTGKTPGLLRGLALCDLCGSRMNPTWSGWKRADGSRSVYLYYVCGYGARRGGEHQGVYNRVRIDDLDAFAWSAFSSWIQGDSFAGDLGHFRTVGMPEKLAAERAEALAAGQSKTRQIENLLGQARDASASVAKLLHAEIERVTAEKAAVDERLRHIERMLADEEARETLVNEIMSIREEIVRSLGEVGGEGRRNILQLLQCKIFVGGQSREQWRFTSLDTADTRW
ncbi:MAG TPA: recombinase zinc beta ribbon domain-containing protein, partial [Blastocatellia bacterium]|nr:recombinase zinc beta ribbon domain-containing protein [Blastocatellia bacterium]